MIIIMIILYDNEFIILLYIFRCFLLLDTINKNCRISLGKSYDVLHGFVFASAIGNL